MFLCAVLPEFAFVGTSGNSSTQAIGLGGEVTVRRAPWTYKRQGRLRSQQNEGELQPEPHRLKVNSGIGYANEQRLIGEDLSTAEFLTGASYKWTSIAFVAKF